MVTVMNHHLSWDDFEKSATGTSSAISQHHRLSSDEHGGQILANETRINPSAATDTELHQFLIPRL